MSKTVNILIACGSGVCTSTVAQEEIKKILKKASITGKIDKCSLNELPAKQKNADVIMVTSNYKKALDKPCIVVFPLISGINKEKCEKAVIDICNEVLKNKIE